MTRFWLLILILTATVSAEEVARLQLTPGLPNTRSFVLRLEANGDYSFEGQQGKAGTVPVRIVQEILKEAETIGEATPAPPAHDRQEWVFRVQNGTRLYRGTAGDSESAARFVSRFVELMREGVGNPHFLER